MELIGRTRQTGTIATAVAISLCAAALASSAERDDVRAWREDRLEELIAVDGWLSVVGLHWLEEGETTFGTDPSADIVFPTPAAGRPPRPAIFGTLVLTNGRVFVRPAADQTIRLAGEPIGERFLASDRHDDTTLLDVPPYRFFVIERQGRLGLRVRDLSRPATLPVPRIDYFPIRPELRIAARFEPYDPPKAVPIPTVLGTINESFSPGALVFKVDGRRLTLDPIVSGDRLFVIFADGTTGRETYGGGRYLYAAMPDAAGRVVLDFNTAHNPPCVFTDYGTCFLPPRQNKLPIRLEAGEKMVEGYARH